MKRWLRKLCERLTGFARLAAMAAEVRHELNMRYIDSGWRELLPGARRLPNMPRAEIDARDMVLDDVIPAMARHMDEEMKEQAQKK